MSVEPAAGAMRQKMRDGFETLWEDGFKRLQETLDDERTYSELCKCGRRVVIRYPDIGSLTKAMEFLAKYGFGTPSVQRAEPAGAGMVSDMAAMSDEQLAAIVAAGEEEADDGETEGL